MYEESCPNTGLEPFECGWLECSPSIHRFKFIGLEAECKTLDDVIDAIQAEVDYFTALKKEGYKVGGAIVDDYLEVYPPKRKEFYWGRCKNCGFHLEPPTGQQQPEKCEHCEGGLGCDE